MKIFIISAIHHHNMNEYRKFQNESKVPIFNVMLFFIPEICLRQMDV